MADVDHPKTHIENQEDAELPRVQPESPKHEGIDPLTEGDTMYPSEETKSESEKLGKKEERADAKRVEEEAEASANETPAETAADDSAEAPANGTGGNGVGSLTDREQPAKVTTERTEPVKADGKVQPQTKTPAKTNDSEVAQGASEPSANDTTAATGDGKSANREEAESNGTGTGAPTAASNDAKNAPNATPKTSK